MGKCSNDCCNPCDCNDEMRKYLGLERNDIYGIVENMSHVLTNFKCTLNKFSLIINKLDALGIDFDEETNTLFIKGKEFVLGEVEPKPEEPDDPEPETKKIKFYVGEINSKASDFPSVSSSDLINNATAKEVEEGKTLENKVNCKHKVFYLLVPSNITLKKFLYTSGGLVSDIITLGAWTNHDNVTIDDISYKVYANSVSVTSESNPLEYTYGVKA